MRIVLPGDFEEDMNGLLGVRGAMDPNAIVCDPGDELMQVFVQMSDHVRLDGVSALPALLIVGDGRESLKPADHPAQGIPIQGGLQVLIRQGLANACAESVHAHRLFRTSAMWTTR